MISILLVDDDRSFSSVASAALRRESMEVAVARSLYEAREAIKSSSPDVIVLDRRLPDGDGMSLIPELRQKLPNAAVVMITAHADVASAVDAIRAGATDYLVKPVELVELMLKVRRSGEAKRLAERLEQAEAEISSRHRLVAPASPKMKTLVELVDRVALSPKSAVLLLGETGVGKEVLARHLHQRSFGESAPFVHVNCAAIPETIFESELFGHERGAFTDARASRRGLIEMASGGTLFLDEIGEMPLALQSKLLSFLDHGRFRRLGGSTEQVSHVRVVAATNRDLPVQAREGRFREDLFFRLSVIKLDIPPLRQRREDIIPLAEAFLRSLSSELGRRSVTLSAKAREKLERYPFPGNVRELRNLIERSLVLETSSALELEALSTTPSTEESGDFRVSGGPITMEELERRYVRHVLGQMGGRRGESAQALDISYPTFLKKLNGEPAA